VFGRARLLPSRSSRDAGLGRSLALPLPGPTLRTVRGSGA
jgi:hypothetical protein